MQELGDGEGLDEVSVVIFIHGDGHNGVCHEPSRTDWWSYIVA